MKRELTSQELLDRYVHSVKTLLPPEKMDDIAAEISSNLQSLIEDRSMQLGRELRVEEVSAILKQHGHPTVVASRYGDRPGLVLIGPGMFPFYWSTLRAILAVWVLVRVIAVFGFRAPAGSVLVYLSRDIMVGCGAMETGESASRAASAPAARDCATAANPEVHGWGRGDLLSCDGSVLARDVLGVGPGRDLQPTGNRLRDAAALLASGIALDFSVLAELYALC